MNVPPVTAHQVLDGLQVSDQQILCGLYPDADTARQHFSEAADDLDGAGAKPPTLNVETMLSPAIRPLVSNVAAHLQVPVEAVALMALSTLSAAAVGRVLVDGRNGWKQPAFVWTTTTMHSGERKTDVVRIVGEPVRRVERRLIAEHKENARAHAKDREDLTAYIADLKAQQRSARRNEKEQIKTQLEDAVERLATMADSEPGNAPAILVEDSTVEALAQRLEENDQRLAVLTDEGGVFSLIAGRYSNGLPNLDLYLKAYDESDVRIDRVSRGTVYLSRPALAIGLLVQPDVLDKAASIPGARDRGLLGRFIFAIPESTLGRRKIDSPALDPAVQADWNDIVTRVLSIPAAEDRQVIGIDDHAHKLLNELRAALEPHLEPVVGRYAHMSDWAGKLAGKVLRVSALYHLAERHPLTRLVDEQTMNHAVTLGLWALRHAEYVHAQWQVNVAEESPGVAWLLEWLARRPRETFTFRDAQQTAKRTKWYAAEGARALEDALCQLVRARRLTSYARYDGRGRQQAKGVFLVRPDGT